MKSFLAALGLSYCEGFSLVAASRGYSLLVVHRPPLQWLFWLWSTGSGAHGLQWL